MILMADCFLIANWNWFGADDIDQFIRAESDNYFAVSTLFGSEFLHVADYLAHFDVTVIHKTQTRL